MGCSPWIPRNSSHRPQYDDTGASRHVESNTVEVLWVSAGFVATDSPSGPRPLPTHTQPACLPARPTRNSEEPVKKKPELERPEGVRRQWAADRAPAGADAFPGAAGTFPCGAAGVLAFDRQGGHDH